MLFFVVLLDQGKMRCFRLMEIGSLAFAALGGLFCLNVASVNFLVLLNDSNHG
jgi:hypothetical protein